MKKIYKAIILVSLCSPVVAFAENDLPQSLEKKIGEIHSNVDRLASTDSQQKVAALSKEFMNEFAEKALQVQRAYIAYNESSVFEFPALRKENELAKWEDISAKYLSAARAAKSCMEDSDKSLKNRFEKNGLSSKSYSDFMKGLREGMAEKEREGQVSSEKLFDAHLNYSSGVHDFVQFLKKNVDSWSINEEGEWTSSSDKLLSEYNTIVGNVVEKEESLNELLDKIINAQK